MIIHTTALKNSFLENVMKNVIAMIRYRNGAVSYTFIPDAKEGDECYDGAKADWERDGARLLGLFPLGQSRLLDLLMHIEEAAQAKDMSVANLFTQKLCDLYESDQNTCLPLLVADVFEAGRLSAMCG